MRKLLRRSILLFMFVLCFTTVAQAGTTKMKNVKLAKGNVYVLSLGNSSGTAKWSTSNKKIVSIAYKDSTKAVIRAAKKGSAKITAKVGKKKYTCTVKVSNTSGIPKKLSVLVGDKITFKQNSKKGAWASSDKSIASVSGKAVSKKITFKKTGTVVITEKIGKKSYKCTVTVLNKDGSKAKIGTGSTSTGSPVTTNSGTGSAKTTSGTTSTGGSTSGSSGSGKQSSGTSTTQTTSNVTPPEPKNTTSSGQNSATSTGASTWSLVYTDLKFASNPISVTLGQKTKVGITPAMAIFKYSNGATDNTIQQFWVDYANTDLPWGVEYSCSGSECYITARESSIYTLDLPLTGTLALESNGKIYKCKVIVNDWGTPDKKLTEDWMTDILNKCKGKNALDTLTNVTKYIATNYPYKSGFPTVLGYVDSVVQKHGWGSPGADCIGSSEAIVLFAERLGLEARISDQGEAIRSNPTHRMAFVTINGKRYDFECGLGGPAGRDWAVYGGESRRAIASKYEVSNWIKVSDKDYRDPAYYG